MGTLAACTSEDRGLSSDEISLDEDSLFEQNIINLNEESSSNLSGTFFSQIEKKIRHHLLSQNLLDILVYRILNCVEFKVSKLKENDFRKLSDFYGFFHVDNARKIYPIFVSLSCSRLMISILPVHNLRSICVYSKLSSVSSFRIPTNMLKKMTNVKSITCQGKKLYLAPEDIDSLPKNVDLASLGFSCKRKEIDSILSRVSKRCPNLQHVSILIIQKKKVGDPDNVKLPKPKNDLVLNSLEELGISYRGLAKYPRISCFSCSISFQHFQCLKIMKLRCFYFDSKQWAKVIDGDLRVTLQSIEIENCMVDGPDFVFVFKLPNLRKVKFLRVFCDFASFTKFNKLCRRDVFIQRKLEKVTLRHIYHNKGVGVKRALGAEFLYRITSKKVFPKLRKVKVSYCNLLGSAMTGTYDDTIEQEYIEKKLFVKKKEKGKKGKMDEVDQAIFELMENRMNRIEIKIEGYSAQVNFPDKLRKRCAVDPLIELKIVKKPKSQK